MGRPQRGCSSVLWLSQESLLGTRIGLNWPQTPPHLGLSQPPHVSFWAKGQILSLFLHFPILSTSLPQGAHRLQGALVGRQTQRGRDAGYSHTAGKGWDRRPAILAAYQGLSRGSCVSAVTGARSKPGFYVGKVLRNPRTCGQLVRGGASHQARTDVRRPVFPIRDKLWDTRSRKADKSN